MLHRVIHVCFIFLLGFGLLACQKSAQQAQTDRYPWEITILGDGSSRVFGVQLGMTNVTEAKQLLGRRPEVGLFENPDGRLSLELFYKEFTRAGLTGRLVLTVKAEQADLLSLKKSERRKGRLESGAVQYRLDEAGLSQIASWPVSAMTYMPFADLEEPIIIRRFGEPAEKIRSHEKAQHWLYPDKGLDLIINEVGKEVLQYVPPAEFEKLASPLRR